MPQEDLIERLKRVIEVGDEFRKRISEEAKKLAEERATEQQRRLNGVLPPRRP